MFFGSEINFGTKVVVPNVQLVIQRWIDTVGRTVVIKIVLEIIHGCVWVGGEVIPEIFVIGLLVTVYAIISVMVIKKSESG